VIFTALVFLFGFLPLSAP